MSTVPSIRIEACNNREVNQAGKYVLYWMTAFRRLYWNFSLEHAVDRALELKKPLLITEVLPLSDRWDSDRLHQFALDGMAVNSRESKGKPFSYRAFIERNPGEAEKLFELLSKQSCAVVMDDFPILQFSRQNRRLSQISPVLAEKVDSNGLLPLKAADRIFPSAFFFRRFLQKELPTYLFEMPSPDPSKKAELPFLESLPVKIEKFFESVPDFSTLGINHKVTPVTTKGGSLEAERKLREFLSKKLQRYAAERNEPEKEATSGLSAYLHYGHISAHQIVSELLEMEGWTPGDLADTSSGQRAGWWGTSKNAETFLDELVTWREIGFNFTSKSDQYDKYESLPDWAIATLNNHVKDPREYLYSFSEFEAAKTHDPLWNAAQMELVTEGKIHNYLRMVWGKKILEWSSSPKEALETMIELNNKYAIDGRNPNSYTGIFWCLGRYDRPWGPERSIFGQVRYMSSENTARKVSVKNYIKKYCPE